MDYLKDITVLITGAGSPGAPGIIKSLRCVEGRNINIVGVDAREGAVGSVLADEFEVIPEAKNKQYISSLLKVAKKFRVDIIFPLNTAELIVLAENKKRFEKDKIKVSISEPKSLKVANNKYRLMNAMKKIIPVPGFYLAKSLVEFEEAVRELGYPEKQVCFKPPVSNGQRGFRILDADADKLKILLEEKPTGIVTTLNDIYPALKEAKRFPKLLVMEYLPGKEYSVDILANNGNIIIAIPRTRDYIKAGISFEGTIVNHKGIIEYSKKVIETLKLNGNIGLQYKEDEKGIPRLIECNPRLQGTTVINTFAGANLIEMAINLILGESVAIPKVKWGTKMIRYWEEVYENTGTVEKS